MKYLYLSFALIATIFTSSARAETINCTEITAIPIVITVQGVYCLKGNLATSLAAGNMIDIQTNNVTIDFNGFKLGGLAGGAGTFARGIFAVNRKNITIRNGSIRGFLIGIYQDQSGTSGSSGHLIEDMLLDGNTLFGILVVGSNMIVRRNRVVNTGPGVTSTLASGISMVSSENSMIADNFISGTSKPNTAVGIDISLSKLIEVRGNTILDTKNASVMVGIDVTTSAGITVIGNSIINDIGTGAGTVGITDGSSSTGVKCINNTITGFTVTTFGCDVAVGNN